MNVGLNASLAAKAYLESLGLETVEHIYAEIEDPSNEDQTESNTRELPCVQCLCSVGEEYPMQTGNYNCDLVFQIEFPADDFTAVEAAEVFEEVWSNISTDSILADINAQAAADEIEFTAFGFTGGIQQTQEAVDGRILSKSIILSINCCAALIS